MGLHSPSERVYMPACLKELLVEPTVFSSLETSRDEDLEYNHKDELVRVYSLLHCQVIILILCMGI